MNYGAHRHSHNSVWSNIDKLQTVCGMEISWKENFVGNGKILILKFAQTGQSKITGLAAEKGWVDVCV